jgi:translation initiation factor 3 subunit D|tara:strand:- start:1047 stop:2024 length:978 start_codon:yes stop_codon:yes gene_type:complete
MPFTLPLIHDNENGWGPTSIPDEYKDVPYAPFEKRAYMGRIADWSLRAEQYRERRRHDNRAPQVTNEAFGFAEDSTEGFNLVDTQKGMPPQPGWDKGMRGRGRGRGRGRWGGGRWGAPQPMGAEAKFNAKFEKKRIPQAAQSKWKKSQQANYAMRWNEQKPTRIRDSSVDVRPEWQVKGQISFAELLKMQMDVPVAEDIHAAGTLHYYEKAFDRITVKTEKPLERIERAFYKVSTSDDPEIGRLAVDPSHAGTRVFATDAILSVLMSAPRSAFSWDVIVNRVGDRLYLDKARVSHHPFFPDVTPHFHQMSRSILSICHRIFSAQF